MKNKLNLRDIGHILNRTTHQLDNGTLDKLRVARRKALQHQLTASASPVSVWLGHLGLTHQAASRHGGQPHKSHHFALAVLLATTLLGGVYYWQYSYEHDHSEIDVAILTDDLPVDMYVD